MAVDYETANRIIRKYVSDMKSVMSIDKVYLYSGLSLQYPRKYR